MCTQHWNKHRRELHRTKTARKTLETITEEDVVEIVPAEGVVSFEPQQPPAQPDAEDPMFLRRLARNRVMGVLSDPTKPGARNILTAAEWIYKWTSEDAKLAHQIIGMEASDQEVYDMLHEELTKRANTIEGTAVVLTTEAEANAG